MDLENTTPEFTNFDEDTGRIEFTEFRQCYKISADVLRGILKKLKYEVVREGSKQWIIGENPHNVSNSYYLKHAVYEYRKTMDITRTLLGDFLEYELETDKGVVGFGISHIESEKDVTPLTPSMRRTPNKKSDSILVPIDKNEQIGISVKSVPPAPVAAAGTDALQVLVAALTAAQKAAAAPDALAPQRALLEAEQSRFLLTPEQLGQLLGMSKSTISSKKSGFRKLGFEFEKVKEGASTLFRVKRY